MSDAGEADVPEPPAPPDRERGSVEVLGTAHVSQASVDEVRETIDREDPDVVAVELDDGRYRQMKGGTPDDIEAEDLLSGNTVFQFLAYWMLSYVQSRLGDQFDISPEPTCEPPSSPPKRTGSGVALVDRDIQVTIQRFWSRLTFTEKLKMVGGLALGVTDPRTIGLTFGAVTGMVIGLIFGAFLAPVLGVGDLLLFGGLASTPLQYAGGAAIIARSPASSSVSSFSPRSSPSSNTQAAPSPAFRDDYSPDSPSVSSAVSHWSRLGRSSDRSPRRASRTSASTRFAERSERWPDSVSA